MATQYTTVLRLRTLPEDYADVKNKAEAYRQPLSAFARNAICGIPMVCHLDEDAVEMLLRLGGLLLKHGRVAPGGVAPTQHDGVGVAPGRVAPGGDSEDAGWTVAQRREFLEMAHRLLGIASRIEESLPMDDGEDSPC